MKGLKMRVEIVVPTKDRYENLALLLWSLCEQTHKEWDVTIIDDSENIQDIRNIPFIYPILRRMDEGHSWQVKYGLKRGPQHSHQIGIIEARSPHIFRVDDDCILDSEALEKLVSTWEKIEKEGTKLGAIASVVVDPVSPPEYKILPLGFRSFKKFQGKIDEYGVVYGDQQWRKHPDKLIQPVEHLYSSFLYSLKAANDIGGYDLDYNKVGHREETDFTYRMFQRGYKLFIQPESLVWHLRNPIGGIRSFTQKELWEQCEDRFRRKFGFKAGKNQDAVIKIFGGLGDHLCATPMIRALKKKAEKAAHKIVISSIYPYLFQDNANIDELIYAPEENMYQWVTQPDVYRWGNDNKFTDKLSEAWCRALGVEYDGDKLDYVIHDKEREWVCETIKFFGTGKTAIPKDKYVLISTTAGVTPIQYVDITALASSKKDKTSLKDWSNQKWEKLVKEIKNLDLKVYQVGGSNDEKIKSCDRQFLGIDYRLSIALLEKCECFVSVDTFLQHAGHAIGKKGVVLFGPTDPIIFGHETNLNICYNKCPHRKSCLRGSPWLTRAHCDTRDCMKGITVKEVLSKVKSLI